MGAKYIFTYHSVCPLVGIGIHPPPPLAPPKQWGGGGAQSPAGEGLGEFRPIMTTDEIA